MTSRSQESFSYIRGKVSNKDVYSMILVDTRNTGQNNIILEEFFKLTGLPLMEQEKMTLGTAEDRSKGLQVIGWVAKLKLNFEGMRSTIIIRPWVVRGLSHPINIGMRFMQDQGAIIQTNKSSNRFIIKGESTRTIWIKAGMFPTNAVDKTFPQNSGQFQRATSSGSEAHKKEQETGSKSPQDKGSGYNWPKYNWPKIQLAQDTIGPKIHLAQGYIYTKIWPKTENSSNAIFLLLF